MLIFQDREGEAGSEGRDLEGGGAAVLRDGGVCDHAVPGSSDLHAAGVSAEGGGGGGGAAGAGGRCREELVAGVPVPDRSLPVVVGVAGAAGPRPQALPGPPLLHLLPVLLRHPPVSRHRRLLREERRGMAHPHRLRGLQRLLRCTFFFFSFFFYRIVFGLAGRLFMMSSIEEAPSSIDDFFFFEITN